MTLAGCAGIDWALLDEKQVVDAIFETAPFRTVVAIEVEAHLPRACEKIMRERSPDVWPQLVEAGFATMRPERLNGSRGCALAPAGKAAKAGGQLEWKSADQGNRWRVPVGAYLIHGTNEDLIIMERPLTGSRSVSFPWTFYSFKELEQVVATHTNAEESGRSGIARAGFARTREGWKVVSLAMTPIEQR